jgi:7,8-dihydropterin-6-yl-methyl-4-(beta-D-ribofuranosyl)aminobenzene 5'-phosphate synthase
MIKINVLLENFSISDHYKSKHGLSIFINCNGRSILLDTGPDDKFIKNAQKMGIDLSEVKHLFLSHNHNDHTGGLNGFMKINNSSNIYLVDNVDCKYYNKFFFLYIPIGLKLGKANYSRVTQVENDLSIEDKIYFLRNTVSDFIKPTFNKMLYKKVNNKIINDNFDHEGILVLDDNGELLIFNSCSHNGLLNVIETVRTKLGNRKIKSYVGGLHLCNPDTGEHENDEYLDSLVNRLKTMDMVIYTGHCTGKYAINYLKSKLGERIQEINTGMEFDI